MEIALFILILIAGFFFIVYVPTTLFLKDKKPKKSSAESLVMFIAISMLFLLLTYLYANYYHLSSVLREVECNNFANINCLFEEYLPRVLDVSIPVYMILFTQLFVMVLYAYYVAKTLMTFGDKTRRIINMVLFFLVSIMVSIIHYYVLYDVAFISGLKYISLAVVNSYIVLPFFYLVVLTYMNRRQLKK